MVCPYCGKVHILDKVLSISPVYASDKHVEGATILPYRSVPNLCDPKIVRQAAIGEEDKWRPFVATLQGLGYKPADAKRIVMDCVNLHLYKGDDTEFMQEIIRVASSSKNRVS